MNVFPSTCLFACAAVFAGAPATAANCPAEVLVTEVGCSAQWYGEDDSRVIEKNCGHAGGLIGCTPDNVQTYRLNKIAVAVVARITKDGRQSHSWVVTYDYSNMATGAHGVTQPFHIDFMDIKRNVFLKDAIVISPDLARCAPHFNHATKSEATGFRDTWDKEHINLLARVSIRMGQATAGDRMSRCP